MIPTPTLRQNLGVTLTLVALLVLNRFVTPYMTVAAGAYLLLVAGLIYRKNRKLHPLLMSAGILMDLGIVLTLQLQRQAVQTAASFSLGPFQQLHIVTSSVATALYFPVLYLGVLLLDRTSQTLGRHQVKRASVRRWHLRLAIAAFIFRSLGFILMFSMLKQVAKS